MRLMVKATRDWNNQIVLEGICREAFQVVALFLAATYLFTGLAM